MRVNDFIHCDNNEKHLTLHDCCSEQAYIQNGILGFELNDGFWIAADHPENDLSKLAKTDSSKVEYVLYRGIPDDVIVYVYKKFFFGKKIRNEWSIDKLIRFINDKKCKFEFLYQLSDEHTQMQIIEGELRFPKRPFYEECCIKILLSENTRSVNYYWNKLMR